MEDQKTLRIDKWLKVARFYKQREKAAEAVENGKVKVNGSRVKPSKYIKEGDELTVKKGSKYFKYTIKGISERSVSAEKAKDLYIQHDTKVLEKEKSDLMKILEDQDEKNRKEIKQKGRPTKKDRRILNKYKYLANDKD